MSAARRLRKAVRELVNARREADAWHNRGLTDDEHLRALRAFCRVERAYRDLVAFSERRRRARERRKAVRRAEYARMAIYGLSPNPILRDLSFVPGEPAPRRHPLPGLTYRTINPDPLGGGG
jgi:hypothetical protein